MSFDFNQMNKIRKKVTEHKSFPYITAVIRGILIYAVYAIMATVTVHLFQLYYEKNTEEYLEHPEAMLAIFQTILLYLVMNTVILAFAIYHRAERISFRKTHKNAEYDARQERKKILRSSLFWTEIAAIVVLFLMFPMYDAYMSLVRMVSLLPLIGAMPTVIKKMIMFFGFAIGILILSICSRMEAYKLWVYLPGQLGKNKLWKSARLKEQRSYSYFRLVLRLVGYLFIYWIGSLAASYVIPIFLSFLRLIGMLSFEGWFWWLIGVIVALTLFLTVRKRMQFIRNLKKTCKKYGFRLFEASGLFFSIFHDSKRYTFGLNANGKIYYCRILASIKRSNKMIFDDEGVCTRAFSLHIPAPLTARSGPFVYMADRGNGDDRVFFHIDSKVNYTFEADGKSNKILILNPVPKRALKRIDGHFAEADNGDRIGEYQIFTGNAFLRHLMRESETYDEKHT